MRLAARALLMALVLGALACERISPPVRVIPSQGGVIMLVQTLGNYFGSTSTVRLSDDRGKVIWDVGAKGSEPQMWTVKLRCGSNSVVVPDHPEWQVFVPKSPTFVLQAKATYVVEVRNPRAIFPARTTFSLSDCP
jgi:hypothetical protein